ncbi:PiggyBac transposable element-derived protein 3 [Trichinella sp. T6]|nr:PiggyBac transposable element-derived protein 3 [Trichinella sp. T6]
MTFCPFSGIWKKQKNSHMCYFSFPFAKQLHKHRQFDIFHEKLSIDEGMVPYYGHHSCKMFIRGKPIRFGYKIWTMSSANVLERPEKHELYFNNIFASYDLLEKLSGKMIRATGTMRNSRTKKIPIMPVDEMERQRRCHSGL